MGYFLILWLVLYLPFTLAQSQQIKEVCGVPMASCPSKIDFRVSGGGSTCAEHTPWNTIVVNINAPPVQPGFKGLVVWCGGVLVTQHHVLSAAHCYWKNVDELGGICPKEFAYATAEDCQTIECPRECSRVGIGALTLYFGVTNRQEPGFGLVRSVKRINIHPGWDRGAKLNNILEGHDIAILTINTKIDLNLPNIQPVCLPYTYTQEVGSPAQVAGFGVFVSPRNGEKTYPSVIQSVTVFVDSKEDCVKQWKIRGNQICARGKIPKPFPGDESFEIVADSCDGDSGGGLTAATGPDQRTVLYGITSFGEQDCGRVGGKSGVYTNVHDHMDWITPIISDEEGVCGPDESCYRFNDTACSELVKSFRSGVILIADLKEKICSTNPSKLCCKTPEAFDDIKFKHVGGSPSSFASSSSGSISNIITRLPSLGGSSSSTQNTESDNKCSKRIQKDDTSTPSTAPRSGNCSQKKVVCYFPSWAYFRPGLGSYKVEDIDASLCSHMYYAFATLDGSTYTMNVKDSSLDIDLKNYEKFVGLRAQFPNKKFLISLGGWTDSRTDKYSTLLASAALRSNFVTKAVEFICKYKFDGLDLFYQYPAYEKPVHEKSTFAQLVKELKTAFKPYGWELTAAGAHGKEAIDAGYDVPEISKYLDAIHLITYDIHGPWESVVGHHAPLYFSSPLDQVTVNSTVNYWLSKGAPKSKLIVAIPTFGRLWKLCSSSTNIGSRGCGPGTPGSIIWDQNGFLSYQEICLELSNGWTVVDDDTGSRGPYAFKGNQWVGYDDPFAAGRKAKYIVDNDLGGAMIWDLSSDDFSGRCPRGKYPMISTVTNAFKFQHDLCQGT